MTAAGKAAEAATPAREKSRTIYEDFARKTTL
jgi:hypothetical protein